MIDIHATILYNLDTYGTALPLDRPNDQSKSLEAQLMDGMQAGIGTETSLQELNRRYPNWQDEIREAKWDLDKENDDGTAY